MISVLGTHIVGEGQHEGEHLGLGRGGLAEDDADAEVHEGGREVHRLLAVRRDREVRDAERRPVLRPCRNRLSAATGDMFNTSSGE